MVRFGMNTGMRRGKLLGRTTEHIETHDERVLLRIGKDKNGEPTWRELFGECREVAEERCEAARFAKKPLLLLPGPRGGRADSSVHRYLKLAVERLAVGRPDLGIRWGTAGEAITFHALRRTFATEARRQGATVDEIQKLGNWRDPEMVRRYVQIEDERASDLLSKMADSFKSDTMPDSDPSQRSTKAG